MRNRAALFAAGELELHQAVDLLQDIADVTALVAAMGQDWVQATMAAAFAAVRDDVSDDQRDAAGQFPPAEEEGADAAGHRVRPSPPAKLGPHADRRALGASQ